jgi:hypothetical protein
MMMVITNNNNNNNNNNGKLNRIVQRKGLPQGSSVPSERTKELARTTSRRTESCNKAEKSLINF